MEMIKYLKLLLLLVLSVAEKDETKTNPPVQDGIEGQNQRRPRQISLASNSEEFGVGSTCTANANGRGVCTRLSGCFSPTSVNICPFNGNEMLLCCPEEDKVVKGKVPKIFTEPSVQGPTDFQISISDVNQAAQEGFTVTSRTESDQAMEARRKLMIRPGSRTPEGQHLAFFQPTEQSRVINSHAMTVADAGIFIIQNMGMSGQQAALALQNVDLRNTSLEFACDESPPECNPRMRYRSADGSCNNLQEPTWGKSHTRFQRLLLPDYADQIFAPRVASDGNPLPSARLLSTSIMQDENNPLNRYTLLLMQWGQFVDHDLTLAPLITESEGMGIRCCLDGNIAPESLRHPGCFPIDIPSNDKFYSKFNQNCMEFVRSTFAMPRGQCRLGYLEQLNSLTHYLDGSQVYGSTLEDANNLREFRSGKLKAEMRQFRGKCLLPPSRTNVDGCTNMEEGNFCFKAGDARVNEQIDLTVMHTLWLREHNRVAEALARINRRWDDNTIYQEARRIVIAELQHITYSEWLPLIIGHRAVEEHDLGVSSTGYGIGYDPSVNPSVTNEFASAAFRFGHSLVQGIVQFGNGSFFELHRNFNNPFVLRSNKAMEFLTLGLLQQNPQTFDKFFTTSLTNNLFQNEHPFGLDLVSLNIQRGRDHGIPGYNSLRQLCGLGRVVNFREFGDLIDMESVLKLQSLYNSVNDVDLFIGGVLEKPVEGGIVGPTFACIIADLFARVKRGDRYFYDHGNTAGSFSPVQLNEVRKVSLARVFCDNLDYDIYIQSRAFWSSRFSRPYPCSSGHRNLPKVDLYAWKEHRKPYGNGGPFNFGQFSPQDGFNGGYGTDNSIRFPQYDQNQPTFNNIGAYQQGSRPRQNQNPNRYGPKYSQKMNRPDRYQQRNDRKYYKGRNRNRRPVAASPPASPFNNGLPSWMSNIMSSFWNEKK